MKSNKPTVAPKYFVGLHSHSTFSLGDAIGRPGDHIDYAIQNNMDALALTDHGNMNGFSHQYLHAEQLRKSGVDFKSLYGVEAYFTPSLQDWLSLYDAEKDRKFQEKLAAKKKAHKNKVDDLLGSAYAEAEDDVENIKLGAEIDEETQGDSGVENEEESKGQKWKNPLYQRNHLVLLAKNDAGLKALFSCISHSFRDGFYKYPRMDFKLLKQFAKGNVIATSACVAGLPAKIVFDNQNVQGFDSYRPNNDNFEKIQKELGELVGRFQETLGEENYYLEIQFNKLTAQHLVNMHLIECSKRTGAPLVVTCDAHYSNPNYWREREIYKAMSQLQIMKKTPEELSNSLPSKIEELKCELYPKNATQVWDTYLETSKDYDFYDDEVVRNAIQRTHTIAHDQIGEVQFDRKVKLPAINKIIEKSKLDILLTEDKDLKSDEDGLSFQQLKKDVVIGAKWRKIENKQEYIDRLKYELGVVKHLKFAKYFLTYAQIMKLVDDQMLIGNARGSAGGSLLSYVLNITQLDPIKHGLLFERFLTSKKKCLLPNTYVLTQNGPKTLEQTSLHDLVMTHTGEYKAIRSKEESYHSELVEIELEDGQVLTSSPNHIWLVVRNGEKIESRADQIVETDELIEVLQKL